jgi:hypothetical protein
MGVNLTQTRAATSNSSRSLLIATILSFPSREKSLRVVCDRITGTVVKILGAGEIRDLALVMKI